MTYSNLSVFDVAQQYNTTTSLGIMNQLTGAFTPIGSMGSNMSIRTIQVGPDNQLYGVGNFVFDSGGFEKTIFVKIDKMTGVATQICNLTAYLFGGYGSITSASFSVTPIVSGGAPGYYFITSGFPLLASQFAIDLEDCLVYSAIPNFLGPNPSWINVYGEHFYIYSENPTSKWQTDPFSLFPAVNCFGPGFPDRYPPGSAAIYPPISATNNYNYVNPLNQTSIRYIWISNTTQYYLEVGCDPYPVLTDRNATITYILNRSLASGEPLVWQASTCNWYNESQSGTIPPIVAKSPADPGFSIYMMTQGVLFEFGPSATSAYVRPIADIGIMFDEMFVSQTNVLHGIIKHDPSGFSLYSVVDTTALHLCDSGLSVGYVFGMNDTLWIASPESVLYSVNTTSCGATAHGTLAQNCTSGTIKENHLFCIVAGGDVYNVTSGSVVGNITPPPVSNFGYDLFTYCPMGNLVLFYENSMGLMFHDTTGGVNITFPFGSSYDRWSVTSMAWC